MPRGSANGTIDELSYAPLTQQSLLGATGVSPVELKYNVTSEFHWRRVSGARRLELDFSDLE
jgi:hypothetical protein